MFEYFSNLLPIYQALVATIFTWFLTALGSSLVFFFKTLNHKMLDAMLAIRSYFFIFLCEKYHCSARL